MPLSAGTKVGGSYELLRALDQGNMGELWVARQGNLREVAIKFVLGARPDLHPRFEAEIRVVAQLRSNYVVRVLDWGTFEDAPFMVMELLSGKNLEVLHRGGGPIAVGIAVDCVVQAAAGLSEAHRLGIVHRDLKPANLFFDEATQTIKVLDFGIAGAGDDIRQSLTHDGAYMGTPNYSAPEQFDDTKSVTAAADIWALGAILYELVAGRLAFPGSFPGVILRIRSSEPEPPVAALTVPQALGSALQRCLEKQPEARFASADALIEAIAEFGTVASQAVLSNLRRAQVARLGNAATAFVTPPAGVPLFVPASGPPPGDTPEHSPNTLEPMVQSNPPSAQVSFHPRGRLVTAVLDRLPRPDGTGDRDIVFMLGAGFSLPYRRNEEVSGGVPGTDGIVQLIRERMGEDVWNTTAAAAVAQSDNKYQTAFDFLDRDVANTVVRRAVLTAYKSVDLPVGKTREEAACLQYEWDTSGWSMPPGVLHLGAIIARGLTEPKLKRFSRFHLTTNFDPLLAVAIRRAGGSAAAFSVPGDFGIPGEEPDRCVIVHVHGRWQIGKTMHFKLGDERGSLQESLQALLEKSVLVVLGYGGWNDVFMQALDHAATNPDAKILWGFYEKQDVVRKKYVALLDRLRPLKDRITFFDDVNCNEFFEQLAGALKVYSDPPPALLPVPPPPQPVQAAPPPVQLPPEIVIPTHPLPWLAGLAAAVVLGAGAWFWSTGSGEVVPVALKPGTADAGIITAVGGASSGLGLTAGASAGGTGGIGGTGGTAGAEPIGPRPVMVKPERKQGSGVAAAGGAAGVAGSAGSTAATSGGSSNVAGASSLREFCLMCDGKCPDGGTVMSSCITKCGVCK